MLGKNTDALIESARKTGKARETQVKPGCILSRHVRLSGDNTKLITNTTFAIGGREGCTSRVEQF
jgi:hypothetical protein